MNSNASLVSHRTATQCAQLKWLRVQLSDFGEFLVKLQEARQNHQDEVTPNPN